MDSHLSQAIEKARVEEQERIKKGLNYSIHRVGESDVDWSRIDGYNSAIQDLLALIKET